MNKFDQTASGKNWVKPELKRINAGSAENGGQGNTDGGAGSGTTDIRDS